MSYAEAIISGIVQGITEFLPVSSSGHLVILHNYFGYKQPQLLFDIFLHIGTLFAVLIYFRRDIINVITKERRLLWLVVIGSVPTAIIGFAFKDIFKALFTDVKMVGIMLFVTAGFLFAAEWAVKKREKISASGISLRWPKALIIGIVQGISIIPGISRSGSTISSGLLLKLDKKEAIRFSFLLAIPAIIGALLLDMFDGASKIIITPQVVAGALTSFLVGLAAIYILIKAVSNNRLKIFGIYCLLAGGAVLIL